MKTLEQIQKERREALKTVFYADFDTFFKIDARFEDVDTFLSESIRIAYKAGGLAALKLKNEIWDAHNEGFRAGLERAKDLITAKASDDMELSDSTRQVFDATIEGLLSSLDDELAKDATEPSTKVRSTAMGMYD